MPKKGSKPPYKPKVEYWYTVKDVAEAAGMTRRALSVEKFRGKVDPGDFKSMVSFLTRSEKGDVLHLIQFSFPTSKLRGREQDRDEWKPDLRVITSKESGSESEEGRKAE